MVVDIDIAMSISIDPLTLVLYYLYNFEIGVGNESLITFLFVHLLASAKSLSYLLIETLTSFRPASQIDVQSLPCGLCCQPNNKADGISPSRT
jgi:hypothetical protein